MKLSVADDPIFDEHVCRGYHPERPERLGAARRAVERFAAKGAVIRRVGARDATDEELERAHDPKLLARLSALRGQHASIDADTYVSPKSVEAARRAAGVTVGLVEDVIGSGTTKGLALVRPPGHHATRARSMGFCLLNNVAVGAAHAIAGGLSRVAIVDVDVHHGNGTEDIFENDPRVLYVSLHESPLYPGSGAADEIGTGDGRGFTVNVPLTPEATPAVYAHAFDRVVVPVLERFAPELVLVSLGFDAHERDPLASMQLDDASYGAMVRALAAQADASAGGRIALVFEGGYDLTAIEGSLFASLDGLAGGGAMLRDLRGERGATHDADVERARQAASATWKL